MSTALCDLCDKLTEAAFCCCVEDVLLCDEHVKAHQSRPATQGHKIITVVDRAKISDVGLAYAKVDIPICPTHPDTWFSQFCMQCVALVCEVCAANNPQTHSGHTLELISQQIYSDQIEKFTSSLKKFSAAELKFDESSKDSRWDDAITLNCKKSKKSAQEHLAQITAAVSGRNAAVHVELDKQIEHLSKDVKEQIEQAEIYVQNIKKSIQEFEAMVEKSNEMPLQDLISARKRIQETLNKVAASKKELHPKTDDTVQFSPSASIFGRLSTSGYLEDRGLDMKKTTCVGRGVRVISPKKHHSDFTIKAVDAAGLPCYVFAEDIKVEFIAADEKTDLSPKIDVEIRGRGDILVSYDLKVDESFEQCQIAVKIKGEHLQGSPYTVKTGSEIEGKFLRRFGGPGSGDGQFSNPWGVAIMNDEVFITDYGNNRVHVFDRQGRFLRRFGGPGSGSGGLFRNPEGICCDSGEIFVCDYNGQQIQVFSPDGTFLRRWGSSGSGDGQLSGPIGISVSKFGLVYVAESGNNRVSVFTREGVFVRRFGGSGNGNGQLSNPWNVTVDDDEVFVVEYGNCRVSVFTLEGVFRRTFGSRGSGNGQLSNPEDIAINDDQALVCDFSNNRIVVFDREGRYIKHFGSNGSADGQFTGPLSIAVDGGEAFIAEYYSSQRIQVFE